MVNNMSKNKFSQYTDRELIMAVLQRRYTGECFVNVVRPYTETVETKTVNGRQVVNSKRVENERIEFGHGMDLHTKYVEFDAEGKLVNFSENSYNNY